MCAKSILKISDDVRASFQPVLKALGPVREALAAVPTVAAVRPGYYYPSTGKPTPAVVVAVTPGTSPSAVCADDLAQRFCAPVSVVNAAPEEQIEALRKRSTAVSFAAVPTAEQSPLERLLTGGEEAIEFLLPKTGAYEPLEPPQLPLVEEEMKVAISVSPEAGWSELRDFLAGIEKRLTVGMYQFTAPHIFEAVRAAVTPPGREFELVLHPVPEKPPASGVKAHDLHEEEEVLDPLAEKMGDRFHQAWATLVSQKHPDGLWASAYHIKVAVRDSAAIWVSSGNWQTSNQPNVLPFEDRGAKLPSGFQKKYNRDYHAVIENGKLAAAFETYLRRDYDLTSAAGESETFALPDLLVPEEEAEALEFAAPPRLFPPLRLQRRVKVQPLLTPDNYPSQALALIESAKRSVWFQNQYINFKNTGEDFDEFQALVQALKTKIDEGLDVRIICRDLMKQASVDVLVALGFPRDVMRFQPACHNKTIIVDGERVMFGSHNWSNEGVKTNRDAGLIFFDPQIAAYLSEVFAYDWEHLATARPSATHYAIAVGDAPPPAGLRRVPFTAIYED